MARVLLLGDPVDHSLSPAMQNAAFTAVGLAHSYELMRVTEGDLGGAVGRVRRDDHLGANVTIPHKERVAPHLDAIDDLARRIGAVNTIYKRDGRLIGDNTDAGGFEDALAERGIDVAGARVLVLGAGGAAKACIDRLRAAGAAVDVVSRGKGWPVRDVRAYAAVVNATPLGMHGEDPLDGVELPRSLAVVDVVATREETPLIARARASGCVFVDGLLMLLHQGTRSFRLWTGVEAPVDVMRAALPRTV